ncbi:MAG TPA: hypothetical protein VLD57_05095 [Blastocatellia bacterium]|nr:hypothetical protein [Blastocatellia bacterium]
MRRIISSLLVLFLLLTNANVLVASGPELVDVVEPYVAHLKLKPEHLRASADRQAIARGLSPENDKEMAAVGIVMADATPAAFVESYKTLATFQQSPYIVASGRFGDKPMLSDLAGLKLDDSDLYALTKSEVKDSEIKLSQLEIARFQTIRATASRLTPQLKARLTNEFKRMLVERVRNYQACGAAALGVYSDKEEPVNAHEAFVVLKREQAGSARHCAHLYPSLESYPQNPPPDSESFIYWAKQRFGDLKPVINVVHVLIHREGDRVYIASKQLYSTHYTEAGLSVAELIPFMDGQGQPRTIVIYTVRLQVDMLGGSFGFMKKRMARPRMLGALKQSLNGMRVTMEALARASFQNRVGS